jgi:hypothetical protein
MHILDDANLYAGLTGIALESDSSVDTAHLRHEVVHKADNDEHAYPVEQRNATATVLIDEEYKPLGMENEIEDQNRHDRENVERSDLLGFEEDIFVPGKRPNNKDDTDSGDRSLDKLIPMRDRL